MAAGIYNFTIEQGATFTRIFKYKKSDGTPINLDEASEIRMHIREKINDNNFITGGSFSYIVTNGTASNNGFSIGSGSGTVTNEITLLIPATSTSAYSFNSAVYDIEIDNQGTTTRLLQGKIKLSKEVTRQ